jgi:hypothetical protein
MGRKETRKIKELYWIKQLKHENSNGTMKEGKCRRMDKI